MPIISCIFNAHDNNSWNRGGPCVVKVNPLLKQDTIAHDNQYERKTQRSNRQMVTVFPSNTAHYIKRKHAIQNNRQTKDTKHITWTGLMTIGSNRTTKNRKKNQDSSFFFLRQLVFTSSFIVPMLWIWKNKCYRRIIVYSNFQAIIDFQLQGVSWHTFVSHCKV